jgi:hypothetical protein
MRIECAREQDRWWLTHPLRARADGGAVDRILAGLAELPKGEVITADQLKARGLSPADYGFEPPRAVFTVGEGPRRWSFRVGRDAPLGGTRTFARMAAIRLSPLPPTCWGCCRAV